MSTVGMKRSREDNEEFERNKKFKPDLDLSVFQIPELVENVLKYLLRYPKMILRICAVSKM